jgi:hypothetical protein
LSIGITGYARSATDVAFTFSPTICLPINNCQFQMIGDHSIRSSTDGGYLRLNQWGTYGTHYRATLSAPTIPESCHFSMNNAQLYLVGYAVWPLPNAPFLPYTLGTGGPWQSNTVCREDPCVVTPDRPSCGSIDKENCPLVVNLGKGAWSLTGLAEPVRFDMDADGAAEEMGWTSPDSSLAFVSLDRNANGVIDDGGELFGEYTVKRNGELAANGFEALQQYDGNLDGRVDDADGVWQTLLLWTDRNHDGVSQLDELVPIGKSGIAALETSYRAERRRDRFGNQFRLASRVQRTNDSEAKYFDIFFVVKPDAR